MSFFKKLFNIVSKIAPVVIAVFAPELAVAIGASFGATGAAASAVGSAVIGGTSALAGGASVEDALKTAALSGAGGYAGSTAAQASGLTGAPASALSGAVSSGTQAALTGKSVGEAALRGGASAGLTAGIKSGLDTLNPPEVPAVPGSGFKKSYADAYSPVLPDGSPNPNYQGIGFGEGSKEGFKADTYTPEAPAFNPDGSVNYRLAEDTAYQTPTDKSYNKQLASLLSKGLVSNLTKTSAPSTSPAKSTTIGGGAGASPFAYGAADILGVDTTPGEVQSKKRAGTEEYPWGEPTGTSSLKQGLGI